MFARLDLPASQSPRKQYKKTLLIEEDFVQRCEPDNSRLQCKILADVSQRANLSTSQRSALLRNSKPLPAMKLKPRFEVLLTKERVPR